MLSERRVAFVFVTCKVRIAGRKRLVIRKFYQSIILIKELLLLRLSLLGSSFGKHWTRLSKVLFILKAWFRLQLLGM